MKRKILTAAVAVSVCAMGLAQQAQVNPQGNMALGAQPNPRVKLLLSNLTATSDTTFGLHSTLENRVANTNVCGAYFKNRLFDSGSNDDALIYGVYLDNIANRHGNTTYGVYANNVTSAFGCNIYGFYANNLASGGCCGNAYGFKAKNTSSGSISSSAYGVYLENTSLGGSSSSSGVARGIHIINKNMAPKGTAHGAYISSVGNDTVFGIYSAVSGVSAAKTYSGYFTGGQVRINAELYAWDSYSSIVRITSDERLKSDIKPLDTEMNKLYRLQGKSYKKAIVVTDLQDSLSIAWQAEHPQKPLEPIQEFGYLAQELQEIFPELVSMDSTTGYYAVNYIGLIPVIVEALKEQQVQIKDQQKINETQQKTNEAQQQKIDALEKALNGCCAHANSLKSENGNTNSAIQELYFSDNAHAETMKLYQNAPNPFNERTTIACYVPQNIQKVQLCVYNMQGVQVQCLSIAERGNVELHIEAGALSSGVYSYVLVGDGAASETKQMILTK